MLPSFATLAALLGAMVLIAFVPGPGVFIVVARSLEGGVRQGLLTTLGIIAGDFVYITCAIVGLSALAAVSKELELIVTYVGAAYLVWLGYSLLRVESRSGGAVLRNRKVSSSSFMAGWMVTLANPKAILFYLSFLPTFINLEILNLWGALSIYLCAVLAVGGVMSFYVLAVNWAKQYLFSGNGGRAVNYVSGVLLILCGLYLAFFN